MPGYSKDTFYKELETEYKNTIKSIEKYGGFYIGRYETGNLSRNTESTVPVVRRMNSTISNYSWYEMYPKMRNMSNNVNIQTSMIWGSLYDETLQWLIQSGEKTIADIILDSGNWGNYQNVGFQYYNNNGELTSTKARHSYTKIPTGSTPRNSANNIYDLCGNVWDWTLEGEGSNQRQSRGGAFAIYGSASSVAQNKFSYAPFSCTENYRFPRILLHQIGHSSKTLTETKLLFSCFSIFICYLLFLKLKYNTVIRKSKEGISYMGTNWTIEQKFAITREGK